MQQVHVFHFFIYLQKYEDEVSHDSDKYRVPVYKRQGKLENNTKFSSVTEFIV